MNLFYRTLVREGGNDKKERRMNDKPLFDIKSEINYRTAN
jgi:hypothetical protein